MKFIKRKDSGFSLVELMIVVAIIGVLASLAVPKFQTFQAKAKQSEAKTNLAQIYTLEEAYYGDAEQYANLAVQGRTAVGAAACAANAIGFQLRPCTLKVRYGYVVAGAGIAVWGGTATSPGTVIVQSCATADVWTMNETRTLTNSTNAVAVCP